MRTFKILFILAIFSLQANATGYVHNMFVAHKKLQSGKEVTSGQAVCKVPAARPVQIAKVKKADVKIELASQNSSAATLNARIVQEGPFAFFDSEKDEEGGKTMISRVVEMMKCVVYAFIGSPKLGNS